MKKKTFKILTLLIIAILCASVLFACNEKDSSSGAWASINEETKPEDIKSDIVSAEEWDAYVKPLAEKTFLDILDNDNNISSLSLRLSVNQYGKEPMEKTGIYKCTKDVISMSYLSQIRYILLERSSESIKVFKVEMNEDTQKWEKEFIPTSEADFAESPFKMFSEYLTYESYQYNEKTGAYEGIFSEYDDDNYNIRSEVRIVDHFPVYFNIWATDTNVHYTFQFYDINNTTVEVPDYEE